MKRIIDTTTGETKWRGEDYLVDGQPGKVSAPLALLLEVEEPIPDHDPETHFVTRATRIEKGKYVTFYEISERPISVPESIEGWQAVMALTESGLLARVMHEIKLMEEPDRSAAIAQFNSGAPWFRHGPILTKIVQRIPEFTDERVDQMFIKASLIPKG